MKRIILSFLFSLTFIFTFAQEHLTFKGIPIYGDLDIFVTLLEMKGYFNLKESPTPNSATLIGEFTNRNAVILVLGNNKKDVWKVSVMFDGVDKWSVLEQTYQTYKNMYIEKYGKPSKVIEKFNEYTVRGNNMEIFALQQGTCKYQTLFTLKEGAISISLIPRGSQKGAILIQYEDLIGSNETRKSAIDDI